MSRGATDPARAHDAARLLPVLGTILLMPPVVTMFAADVDVAGVPLIVVYLFTTWLALIGCAAWLARRLAADGPGRGQDESDRRG